MTRRAIDWNEIGTQWRDREYRGLDQAVSTLEGLAVDDVVALLFATVSRGAEDVQEVLKTAFAAAKRYPDGELLLALYVYGLCLDAWEHTEDYTRIRTVLHALGAEFPSDGAPRDELLANIVSQAQLLDTEMSVEEAMNCSCPVTMRRRARDIVNGLQKPPKQDPAVRNGLARLQSVVQSDAQTSMLYFTTIRKVAYNVGRFVPLNAQDRARFDFDPVLNEVKAAEGHDDIKGDVYESELRAHRFSLQALRDHATGPHLLIREAELVYLYPFALEGITAAETIDLALGDVFMNDRQEPDLPLLSAKKLNLNDLWKPHGGEPPDDDGQAHVGQRGYSGAMIELPPITVTTTAGVRRRYKPLEFTAEVRLSSLGNHHVRLSSKWSARSNSTTPGRKRGNDEQPVWSSLGNADRPASLHEVNQALRRGSHGMGVEKLTSEGHPGAWNKFPDYAERVIDAIASRLNAGLDAHEAEQKSLEPSPHHDQGGIPKRKRTPVKAVGGVTFHVVLAARSIEVEQRDGTRLPATPDCLQKAVGASLLFHPVRHLTTSLEEWIRYPPPKVTNLLEAQGDASDLTARIDQGYNGDLVARTDNTTVTYMPASPEWLAEEYEEMIEFVASIPPLFTLWEKETGDLTGEVDTVLERVEQELDFLKTQESPWRVVLGTRRHSDQDPDGDSGQGPDGGDPIGHLYEQELKIRRLESDIRERLALLHSPALCRTRGQRQFLDNLWEAAGMHALERELEQRLSLLAERQARMAVMVSSIDQQVRRKLERPVTIVLGLLGVASLAEVLSWVNQALEVNGQVVVAGVEALALFVAVVVVVRFYRGTRRSR